jgi:hypothetical protein
VGLDYKKLVEGAKKHPDQVLGAVNEGRSLKEGRVVRDGGAIAATLKDQAYRPEHLDLGRLFVECYGWRNFERCRTDLEGCARLANKIMESARLEEKRVEEAGGASTSDAFLNITQQFAYTKILDAYDIPSRVFLSKIPSRPSKFKFERVPGISQVGDENLTVGEGQDYPEVGPTEDWIDTPETRKRGMVARATKEVVFFDQTGQFLNRLGFLGDWLGVNDEKRAIICIVDAGETNQYQYQYTWRNNKISTYGANTGTHTWDNLQTGNSLVTYANVQAAWQLLVQILDPYTGEPQNVNIKHICVPPALAFAVPFALKGMTKKTAPGYATSGNPLGTEIPNPTGDIIGNIETLSSQLFRVESGSDTNWFIGDIGAAFEQIENWPMTVATLGGGSQIDFDRDVIFQAKVSKRSTFNTVQPRRMVKCTP